MKVANSTHSYASKLTFRGDYLLDTGAGNSDKYSGNVAGRGKNFRRNVELPSTPIPKSQNEAEFLRNWARIAAQLIPKNDKDVKIVAFMPGPSTLNHEGKQEVALTNIGGFKLTPQKFKNALKQAGVNVKKFLILNDGHAHNTNIFAHYKKMFLNPQFVGALNAFPGGGFGGATMRKEGNHFVSTCEERGHELYPASSIKKYLLTKEMKAKAERLSIEEYSTSVPAAIRNFAKAAGYSDKQTQVLMSTKEGRIVSPYVIKLNADDIEQKSQIDVLEKTGMFANVGEEGSIKKFTLLAPDGKRLLTKEEHSSAMVISCREFFNGIGVMLSRFETQNMGNTVVIPTKLAQKLGEALEEQGISPVKVVQQAAWNNLDDAVRKNVVKAPENQHVLLKYLGDPCSMKNIGLLLSGHSPKGDGFREIKIRLPKVK